MSWNKFLNSRIDLPETRAAIVLLDRGWPMAEVARVIKRDREALGRAVEREREAMRTGKIRI